MTALGHAPSHARLPCRDIAAARQAVQQTRGSFGATVPILVLRGSRSQTVTKLGRELNKTAAVYGQGRSRTDRWWRVLFNLLLAHGFFAPPGDAASPGGR